MSDRAAYMREWRLKNLEKVRGYERASYERHRESARERQRAARLAHPEWEKNRAAKRQTRYANDENYATTVKGWRRAWRVRNPRVSLVGEQIYVKDLPLEVRAIAQLLIDTRAVLRQQQKERSHG